ncbi:hypothetical protein HZA85_01585 [Candidatus Uhrbacteria bacterium]|nr:hypothetical protein [Candidatus Uhrbacteria bacterium]
MRAHLAKNTSTVFTRAVLMVVTAFFVFFSGSLVAHAASKKGFEALQVSAPKQGFEMAPGATQTVSITVQNMGTKTWVNTGSAYVSIYTYDPKYRVSDFHADNWKDFTQAAVLKEASVAPGKVGHVDLTLKAPQSVGDYKETFQLAAENTVWIPGGKFTLSIKVKGVSAPVVQKPTTTDGTPSPVTSAGLSATLLLRSAKEVTAEAGEEVRYRVGVKNTGTVIWKTREIRPNDVAAAAVNTYHSSWVSATQVAMSDAGEVKPGALDLIDFSFTAPPTKGKHVVTYRLAVNGSVVPDFEIDIPVEVTTGAQEALESPLTLEEGQIEAGTLIDEPVMRIGVLIVDDETDWQVEIGCDGDWKLIDGAGGLLGELTSSDMVRAFYKNQRYYFNRGKGIEQTYQFLRFVPNNPGGVCIIQNFDRRKTRNAAYADNQFRGTLELRYNNTKDRTWIINELPTESYLAGLGETSEISHPEFKKALITVARTYALYHYERATKHASEFFHMNSTADDQVYKGYGYEIRNPSIGRAATQTRGVVVTYDNRTALTPYFSRSDGRTRDWSEVWGGSVAWLKSVPAPCDARKGRTLWGHGVGMSASEALCMADEGGQKWQDILKYFYQGIDLKKKWN